MPTVVHVMQTISVADPAAGGSGADQRFTPLLNLHESEHNVHKQGTALLPKLYALANDQGHIS